MSQPIAPQPVVTYVKSKGKIKKYVDGKLVETVKNGQNRS